MVSPLSVITFSDLPDDVHLSILSFLDPRSSASAALVSRRFLSLTVRLFSCAPPSPRFLLLLLRLSGLWRRISDSGSTSASLAFFHLSHSTFSASFLSPAPPNSVAKTPFVSLGCSADSEPLLLLHNGNAGLVPGTISFVGNNHIVVEGDNQGPGADEEIKEIESGSPPDRVTEMIYMHFANRRRSPGKHRRKEKTKRFETAHFMRIENYSPNSERPLQGLWKGMNENNTLEFYLVAYDDIGGITCRQIGVVGMQSSTYSPVFWTSSTVFLEPPFSEKEDHIYTSREHIKTVDGVWHDTGFGTVSQIIHINSSYDIVIPNLCGLPSDMSNVEGRIWLYKDGTFGFGFLRNDFIIDLKHVIVDGCIVDA